MADLEQAPELCHSRYGGFSDLRRCRMAYGLRVQDYYDWNLPIVIMSEVAKKWYVVRTAGGKEKKAKEYIEKEIENNGLQDRVSQVLIPTEKYYQIKNGKRVSAERVLFPGYIYIEAALTGEIEHIIKNITFVAGFLSENTETVEERRVENGKVKMVKTVKRVPVPLRQAEIARILGAIDSLADQEEETVTPFAVGEPIKITDGPFNGFEGTVEKIMDDKRKLAVTVKIFGRKTLVELNFAQVTKV